MAKTFDSPKRSPLRVGIIGTGYAAKMRAEAFQADPRAQVVVVGGHTPETTAAFAQTYGIAVAHPWQTVLQRDDIDLVAVCHVNREHGAAVRAALRTGKSVIVEYPLSLSPREAAALIALAQQQRLLLHVEHIELLGGLHQAMKTHLPEIGKPTYLRYSTAVPQRPAPQRWTYDASLFGFPLMGALSRLHRLTNLLGRVRQVSCLLRYDGTQSAPPVGYFKDCCCVTHLEFQSGAVAEVLYAKGEYTWRSQRYMEIQGDRGALVFDGSEGHYLSAAGSRPIAVGSRRGLFARDTIAVLEALYEGQPLYVSPQESLYALQVAAAAAQSARTGERISLE